MTFLYIILLESITYMSALIQYRWSSKLECSLTHSSHENSFNAEGKVLIYAMHLEERLGFPSSCSAQ